MSRDFDTIMSYLYSDKSLKNKINQYQAYGTKIVNEYDQEIPQTEDNPVAPGGRATQSSRKTRKTNKAKQPALSSLLR